MKPAAKAWVRKAEGDFATASRESRARLRPNHDAVCFHAQQCVEKYLKAILTERKLDVPRIHDLVKLAEPLAVTAGALTADLHLLTRFAVTVRYPGDEAGPREAREAMAACRRARPLLKHLLRRPR